MANYSGKEYWLYKEIEEEFHQSVDPEILLGHIKECLTEEDMIVINMIYEVRIYKFS